MLRATNVRFVLSFDISAKSFIKVAKSKRKKKNRLYQEQSKASFDEVDIQIRKVYRNKA